MRDSAIADAADLVPATPAKPPAPPQYTIAFPAPSKASETSVQTIDGPMPQRVETAELDGAMYLVVSGTSPPGLAAGNSSGSLDRVLAMFGATSTRDVAIKLGDLSGREVHFTGTGSGILRTFSVGSWMIQAGVVARGRPVDERQAKRFLDSLKIQR